MVENVYRIETLVRTEEEPVQVLCSTEFNLISGPDAIRNHAEKLQSLIEEESRGGPLDVEMPEEVANFWNQLESGHSSEELKEKYKGQLETYEDEIEMLHMRLDEESQERERLAQLRGELRAEIDDLQNELMDKTQRLENVLEENSELKSELESLRKERNRLAHMDRSGAVSVIRQWVQNKLVENPQELVTTLFHEGVTSEEIADWATDEGYETSPRSLGNTISKHPHLQKIFTTKGDSKPARWVLDEEQVSSEDFNWLFAGSAAVDRFVDAIEATGETQYLGKT